MEEAKQLSIKHCHNLETVVGLCVKCAGFDLHT